MIEAATKIGRSRSIGYSWAQHNTEFAERFAPYRTAQGRAATAELFPAERPASSQPDPAPVAIREMAMKRLIDEIRQNGPAAVLASAAILLCENSRVAENALAVTPSAVIIPPKPPKPTPTDVRRSTTAALHEVFDVKSDDRPITATCKQIADMLHRHSGQTFGDPVIVSDAVSNFCTRYFAKGRFKNGDGHAFSYLIPIPRKIVR